jgi:hypothetical protein
MLVHAMSLGCSSPDPGTQSQQGAGGGKAAPTPLPALTEAQLTTEATFEPAHAIATDASRNPQVVDELQQMLAEGWGELKEGPGQAVVQVTQDGSAPPAPGPGAKVVARWVHLADTQLVDDESPARLATLDFPGLTSGAFRPQEGHECRILNAAVRTINAVHAKTPLSFVLVGGDNADNAQSNELGWFSAILDGAPSVECDSGADDDPTPGPDNDPKDPFFAEGLKMPWRWVTGNHDILQQGNVVVGPGNSATAVGTYAANGTRDWSQPGGPVIRGDVIPDPRRALMDRATLMQKVHADGDGHGVDEATAKSGKAFYSFDVEGSPVRVVVVDTAAETGGASGVIHQADVESFLKPALDKAKSDKKWVVVASHHSSQTLSDGGDIGGSAQPDALTADAWRSLLGSYDNVLLHLAGHTHVHRYFVIEPKGGHAYYEVETAALADFPHQMNVIEVRDEDNGQISLRVVPLDYSVEGDPVAAQGRTISVVDLTSGWGQDGRGDPKQRAVELWIPKPK